MATLSLLLTLSVLLGGIVSISQGRDYLRVCYYTNWAQYRPGLGRFTPANIQQPSLCTHIIYAFLDLSGGRLKLREWNDAARMKEIQGLKTKTPGLKLLVAVGGWNAGTDPFSNMAASKYSRKLFIDSAIQLIREHQFDGLDLDWEYPNKNNKQPQDTDNFSKLVEELKAAFKWEAKQSRRSVLLLSAAVAAGKSQIDRSYNVKEISRHLDFINLMAYDLHGSWESKTGENAPLYPRPGELGLQRTLNVNFSANYWVALGAPREKLVIGMAAYGRSFTLVDGSQYGIGAPASGPGSAGKYTREPGMLAYYEVCSYEDFSGVRFFYDTAQRVPYLVKEKQWVGYDNMRSIIEKVQWLTMQGFGGAMIWALDLDDFGSQCRSSNGRKFPLLQAIRYGLLQEGEQSYK